MTSTSLILQHCLAFMACNFALFRLWFLSLSFNVIQNMSFPVSPADTQKHAHLHTWLGYCTFTITAVSWIPARFSSAGNVFQVYQLLLFSCNCFRRESPKVSAKYSEQIRLVIYKKVKLSFECSTCG